MHVYNGCGKLFVESAMSNLSACFWFSSFIFVSFGSSLFVSQKKLLTILQNDPSDTNGWSDALWKWSWNLFTAVLDSEQSSSKLWKQRSTACEGRIFGKAKYCQLRRCQCTLFKLVLLSTWVGLIAQTHLNKSRLPWSSDRTLHYTLEKDHQRTCTGSSTFQAIVRFPTRPMEPIRFLDIINHPCDFLDGLNMAHSSQTGIDSTAKTLYPPEMTEMTMHTLIEGPGT